MYKAILVDDEFIVTEALLKTIQWDKYNIEIVGTASDGIVALDLFNHMHPDIVFTDIRMPGRTGLELITTVKEIAPETLFVVFSGFNEFEYVKKALQLGVVDYLEKPMSYESVENCIQKVISRLQKMEEERELKNQLSHLSTNPTDRIVEIISDFSKKHVVVQEALKYIFEDVGNDLSLNAISEKFDMNSSYFSVLFKEEVGTSYIKFVTNLRIEKAKELLTQGMKVSKVSEKVGYFTYRHFSDVFKKYTGQTPGEFREVQMNKEHLQR